MSDTSRQQLLTLASQAQFGSIPLNELVRRLQGLTFPEGPEARLHQFLLHYAEELDIRLASPVYEAEQEAFLKTLIEACIGFGSDPARGTKPT